MVAVSMLFGACAKAPSQYEAVNLEFWSGPFGGTPYTVLFAIMDTMNKTHPYLRGSILETQASWDNAFNSGKDPAKRPYVVTHSDWQCVLESSSGYGKRMEGKTPIPWGDRIFFGVTMNSAQLWVTFDPKIKTGKDLIGKRVAGWKIGSGAYATAEMMFNMWGLSVDDFASYDGLSSKAKVSGLKDGLVDAIHLSELFLGDPNMLSANLAELMTDPRPLYWIPMPKTQFDVVGAEKEAAGSTAYKWQEIPAGFWFENMPAQGTLVVNAMLYFWKEMPEDIQYEIAKLCVEHSDEIAGHGAQASIMIPSIQIGALPDKAKTSMAPGAMKYYKEAGLIKKYKPNW